MPRVTVFQVLSVCLSLLAPARMAAADCVSACKASVYCDSDMNASGECGRRLNDCYINQCSRKTYGSIAYGAESGSYGWSHDFDDAQSAENEALRSCRTTGTDCQVVVDFWNTCAAVAAGGRTVEYGLGESRGEAEDGALTACRDSGGAQCAIRAWACTGL